MSRTIKYIVLHCTATSPQATVAAIKKYWTQTMGWKSPGYHYLIDNAGRVHKLQDEQLIANGVAGFNSVSIHVSYIGGVDGNTPKDTRNALQLAAMETLVKQLHDKYPHAIIQGHRDFPNVKKACPSFDVADWLKTIGITNKT